jgi:hypothetical protein
LGDAGVKININNIPEGAIRGPRSMDLTFTGLDEIMGASLWETVDTAARLKETLRMAAYINAINKINKHYDALGILI